MPQSLDLERLFEALGRPGETLSSSWAEAILCSIKERGRIVASHETFGVWPGCTAIYTFEGLYFAEYKKIHGPFTTFDEAARRIHFFYITEAAPRAWIDSDLLMDFRIPPHWKVINTDGRHTFISPMPPDADGAFPLGDEETPLQETAREIEDTLRATGIAVTHVQPSDGPQPLVATFRQSPTKRKT